MPKITPTHSALAQVRVSVSRQVRDSYYSALERAEKLGLFVDVRADFEQLLRRITRVVNSACDERQQQHQEPTQSHE